MRKERGKGEEMKRKDLNKGVIRDGGERADSF